jgi:hypothetical protein
MIPSMFRKAMVGDGSTLNLDFTTMTATADLTARGLTFTRGSTGTRINASGFVETMSNNVARFDHDPTTLTPRGLLIEGSASNVLQYSEAVDQSPWFTAGTVARATFTGGNGPNGVNNSGSKLSATSISSASSLYYNGLTLTAQTYTMSVFAKADGANWIWVNIQQGATIHGAFFDLSGNGALGNTTGTVVSGSNIITKYQNGWFRLQFSFTGTASSWFPVLLPCTSNGTGYASITGQAPNGVLVYGCQIETGSGASSYIPTGASQATRNSDICYITNTDYGFTTTGGTYFVEWERGEYDNPTVSGSDCFPFSTDYASGRWLAIFTTPGGTTTSAASWSGQINQTSTAVAGRNRAAVSYAGWNATTTLTFSANGNSPTSNASMTLGTTPTYLMIGAASSTAPYNGGGLRDILGNRVRRLKYWPFVLPSATLQSITVNTP